MQEEQTDAQLVRRTQADDTSAFNQLIERYQVMLICIALRYVADEEVARELVQEAFLQAYLSLDQLREAASFKNWLYGIVVNMCRNWLRKYKGMPLTLNTSSGRWQLPVHELTPDVGQTIQANVYASAHASKALE